jgi:hypothetical protein
MSSLAEQIQNRGWAEVPFGMSQADREHFAMLGRDVILLATEDPEVAAALEFKLDPSLNVGGNNPTFYGVSEALNSGDAKIWIHSGYNSRSLFEVAAPHLIGVRELELYFDGLETVMEGLKTSFITGLRDISSTPEAIEPLFFPNDLAQRVMHVRTVRYLGLNRYPPGYEVFKSHGDMGVATIQFYETHANYLRGVPVQQSMLRWDREQDRLDHFRELETRMQPVEYDETASAAFFYGFAVAGINHEGAGSGLDTSLPALYHGGYRPEGDDIRATGDWMLEDERVSVIGFVHPRLEVIQDARLYRLPSVELCRPLLA